MIVFFLQIVFKSSCYKLDFREVSVDEIVRINCSEKETLSISPISVRKIKDLQIRYKPEVSHIMKDYSRPKNSVKTKRNQNRKTRGTCLILFSGWHAENVSAQKQL